MAATMAPANCATKYPGTRFTGNRLFNGLTNSEIGTRLFVSPRTVKAIWPTSFSPSRSLLQASFIGSRRTASNRPLRVGNAYCLRTAAVLFLPSMAAAHFPTFRGRTHECAVLDHLLETVRSGHSGVLVIRGEAGVGKTALLWYITAQAADFQVAKIIGNEAERELPFAALHGLCGPLLDHLARTFHEAGVNTG